MSLHASISSLCRGLAIALLMCTTLILMTSPVLAQQTDPAAMDDMFDAIEFDREKGKREPLPPSNVKPINLGVHWQLITHVIKEGKEAESELRALREHQVSMGTRNDPAYMLATIKLIEQTHDEGKISTAHAATNLKAAHILGHDLPYAHLAHAKHLLRHSPGKLGEITKSLLQGWKTTLSWHDAGRPLRYNMAINLLLAMLGSALVFTFMQIIRYFSVLSYDIVRILPRGFSSVQSVLTLLTIIIIPGLLLQSPLLSLFLLLCGTVIVQQPRERLVTLLCFTLFAALPTLETSLSPFMTWNVGSSQQLMHAQYTRCDERCTDRWISRQKESEEKDIVLDYTAWLLHYKSGRINALLSDGVLTEARVATWPKTPRGHAYTLLGAALLANDQPEEAITILTQAEALIPQSAAPSLNIMRAAQMTGDRDVARAALDRANARDLDVTRAFLALARRDVNTTLRVDPLPLPLFWSRHLAEDHTHVDIIAPIWPFLAGAHLPFEWALWMGLIGIALTLLTIPIPLLHKCSTPCPSCGLARSPHDSEKNSNHPYCMSCYEAFIMGSSMSYNERVASDAMLNGRRRRQHASRRFLSLILPGSGHILAGYGFLGTLMVTLCFMALLMIFNVQGVWRAPSNLLFEDWFGLRVMAGLLLLALLGIALWVLRQGLQPVHINIYHHHNKAHEEPHSSHGGRS